MAYEPEPRKWEQKDWLYEQYWGEMLSVEEIAEKVGVSRTQLRRQMDEFGIVSRTVGYLSENQVSPFKAFYNEDENAQTDEQSRKHFDPDAERNQGNRSDLQWQKNAKRAETVGDAAIFEE